MCHKEFGDEFHEAGGEGVGFKGRRNKQKKATRPDPEPDNVFFSQNEPNTVKLRGLKLNHLGRPTVRIQLCQCQTLSSESEC